MPVTLEEYPALTAMITPAIFLTANGSLIISTSNRMSRIVDRIRVLNDEGDDLCRGISDRDFPELRLGHVEDQLRGLVWRSDRIRLALALLYLAFGAFVGTSLALAIDVWFGSRITLVPTMLALMGVSLMLTACLHLVREAFAALRSNRHEILFYQELRARRRAGGPGCIGQAVGGPIAGTHQITAEPAVPNPVIAPAAPPEPPA